MKNPLFSKKAFYAVLILTVLPLHAISLENVGSIKVVRIVDGDTPKVNYKGKEESIRLIGIDAPESRPNQHAKNDAQRTGEDLKTIITMGKEATT